MLQKPFGKCLYERNESVGLLFKYVLSITFSPAILSERVQDRRCLGFEMLKAKILYLEKDQIDCGDFLLQKLFIIYFMFISKIHSNICSNY